MPIILPFLVLYAFLRDLKLVFKDQEARLILLWILVVLFLGAAIYSRVEGWSFLDSIYFCVITLATVGYGDFAPTTPFGRLFTIFYVLTGISLFLAFVNLLAKKKLLMFAERKGLSDSETKNLEKEI